MIIFPAIDLKQGKCVRLEQGDMTRATVFNASPAQQARMFAKQGFDHLHLVDLDGAFAGGSVNGAAVEEIIEACPDMLKQLGGGIRNLKQIEGWLSKGIDRVILGTIAVRDPALVREACKNFPDKIIIGIDARDGRVAVEGWAEASSMTALALAAEFEDAGVAAIIYTDIERDGMLGGINIAATAALAQAVSIPIIASGGLSSIDDVKALLPYEADGVVGAISGRALYNGRLIAAEIFSIKDAPC